MDNVISQYTAEQALDDGFLVCPFPSKMPSVFLTRGVHEAIEGKQDGRNYAQKVAPLILDALMIVRKDPNDHLWTRGLEGNVTGRDVWIGLNERNGITLMFPEEY